MSGERDVIVIGGGHNGFVAAAYLARAGLDVLAVERNRSVGGAVASSELTEAGVVHDKFATNMNLFLGSPAFAELGDDLACHGLSFATTDRPYASVCGGGTSLRVYRDEHRTREALASGSHEAPLPGLYQCGASTHPGPGLNAASGRIVAQRLLNPPLRRRLAARLRRGS